MTLSIGTTRTLRNGVRMPLLGLGTYKTTAPDDIVAAVGEALAVGYRNIDTASFYGNEAGVGAAISASGIERDAFFVSTKVWNDEQGYESTLAAFERSVARLGLDVVDLYLVHWSLPQHMADTWRAMEELYETGRVRAIGVCNHLEAHLERLEHVARIMPMVNQIEHHPWLQQPDLIEYCEQRDIVVEAWGPIMRGHLAEAPELAEIGERYGATAAQVALRWAIQRDVVVIPKSTRPERVRENADLYRFGLSDADMDRIKALDRGERLGPHPDSWSR